MTRRLIGLILLFCSAAGPVLAGGISTLEVGAFGGVFFGDADAGVDDDLVVGARVGVAISRTVQFEVVVDRVDTVFASISFGDLDEEITSVSAHWVFNYPTRGASFVPYFFAGIGQVDDEVDFPSDPTNPLSPRVTIDDDDTFFPWGGGFRAFTTRRVSVRVEARVKRFDTFGVRQDSWELTTGLSLHLGRAH
ncbi:MAG: outer membrane beta-barrel protein [Rhodospirillales bacterium]